MNEPSVYLHYFHRIHLEVEADTIDSKNRLRIWYAGRKNRLNVLRINSKQLPQKSKQERGLFNARRLNATTRKGIHQLNSDE